MSYTFIQARKLVYRIKGETQVKSVQERAMIIFGPKKDEMIGGWTK
jgi:hypothetical protein